jgi:hypothetical protein
VALLAAGSALVASNFSEDSMMAKTVDVKVLRAFYYERKVQEVDSKITLPFVFGMEMVSSKKAVVVEAEAAVAPAEMAAVETTKATTEKLEGGKHAKR